MVYGPPALAVTGGTFVRLKLAGVPTPLTDALTV
jgi:hypothetical protein